MNKKDFIDKHKGTYRQFLCYEMIKSEIGKLKQTTADESIRMLDIGCAQGWGFDKARFLTLFDSGIEKHGADIAPLESIDKDIIFHQCDFGKKTKFENNFFNIVFAGEIIEHVLDTDLFLSEMHRILKPNGVLVLTTPNLASLDNLLLWMRKEQLSFVPHRTKDDHLRVYSPKSLIEHLRENSFSLENIKTSEHYVSPVRIKRLGRLNAYIGAFCKFLYKTILPLRGAHIIVKVRKV